MKTPICLILLGACLFGFTFGANEKSEVAGVKDEKYLRSGAGADSEACKERKGCFDMEVNPVCGLGVSFENECVAKCLGVRDYEIGACAPEDENNLSAFNGEPEEGTEGAIVVVEEPLMGSEDAEEMKVDLLDPAESYPLDSKPGSHDPIQARKKAKGLADIRTTTMKEVWARVMNENDRRMGKEGARVRKGDGDEDDHPGHRRLDYFNGLQPNELATLNDSIQASSSGNLELGLDILASTLITGLCLAAGFAAAGATAGMSAAYATLFCPAVGFWSGIIFSSFDWLGIFGDTGADDAWWTVEAANCNYADGDSLGISYWRGSEVDRDSLGHIDRGEIKSSREDLDSQRLDAIEVRVEDTDDVCVKNMAFRVGREPSGTGEEEEIAISGALFAYLASVGGAKLHNTQEMCIYFGDSEGAIGNFKFHWPSALKCHQNFASYMSMDYARCMTWAVYRYDIRKNGQYWRYTFLSGGTPSLPSHHSSPMRQIKSRYGTSLGRNLCFHLENGQTSNYTPVKLVNCNSNSAQRFDFDYEGRLRSQVDPTKCVEAGKAGTLYRGLYTYDCHNGDWQRWTRYSSGRIKNVHHGKYIGLAYCKAEHGRALELKHYESGTCGETQKFNW